MNLFVRKVNKIKEERKKERTHKYMFRKRKERKKRSYQMEDEIIDLRKEKIFSL